MIVWKRSLRLPSSLRRWIATVRAVLFGWSVPYWKPLVRRCELRSPRMPSFRPVLEGLENRELLNGSAEATNLVAAQLQTNTALVVEAEKIEQQVLQTVVDNFQHSPFPALVQQAEDQLGQFVTDVQQWLDQWMQVWMPPPAQTSGGLIGHDPTINAVEGASFSGPVVSFTDSDGNTDPSKYTASINWGDNQTTSSNMIGYSNGQFQVYGIHTYAEEGTYPITVTITDSDGAQTTVTATAIVSDAALTSGMPYSISATAGQAFSGPLGYINDANTSASASDFSVALAWGDNQTSAGSVTSGGNGGFQVVGSHTYSTPGTYTITATVTDQGGSQVVLTSTATVTAASSPLSWLNGTPSYQWTQTAVANPSIISPMAQTNTENDNVSLQIQASDPNHYPLSYDAVNLPPGLSINSSTGLISGTIAYGAAADFDGSYTPTVIVANNQGGSAQASFTWTVNQVQTAPTFTTPGDQSNLRGDPVSLQINASQVDTDPLTYDATNLPVGLSIDSSTGLISGTVDPSATLGTPLPVTLTVTDEATNLTASQTFNWTIAATNVAPVLTNPGNQSDAAGDDVSLQLSATDADGDALTYTASGLPAGLTLDPIAGTITGTLPNSAASSTPYNVTVTASDGQTSSSQSFTWTVNAISLQNPGDQSNLDGDSVSLPLSASDASNGTLSYGATGLPAGLSINSSTGLISGTLAGTADASSPYAVTVTATDGTNTATQSFNWTVAKLALNPVDDQDNQEGTVVSLQLSATDNSGTPTYSATGLPPGVSLNSTTGLISGTVGLGAFGSSPYQVTVTATDGSNTSSQSFVWTVTPRVALVNPGPQSNATGDSVSLQATATSPGGTMTYSASGLPDGVSINSSTGLISGTLASTDASTTPYTVTVTANDGTSSSRQTFPWTVSAINLVSPGDQSNNDGDAVNLALTTGYHGSGTLSYSADGLPPGVSINYTTGQITGTISGTADTDSPYQVTVTATDGTNTSTQSFNWTVNAVVSVDAIDDQTNAAGDAVSLPVSASDANNATLSFSAIGLPPGLSISSTTGLISGTIATGADANSPYAVTVTVNDGTTSATQTFNWMVTHVALVNPGPQQSLDGAAVSLQLQGGDADGDAVSYTATGLPPGLSLNGSTGLISGTLSTTADTSSPYNVTVTASDGTHTTTQTFLWTVSQVVLAAPSDQTNSEGDNVSLQLQGLVSSGTLSYSASGLPDGLSINPATGLISGAVAPGAAANGPFTVDVSASNGMVSTSQTLTWNVNPVVTLTAPADQSNNEGDSISLPMAATDALSNPLTYSADGLPAGLSINSSTGLISGTISAGDAANGPYVVTVTASDGTYSSTVTFTWNVTHTDTTVLTMTNPGTQTNVAGDSVNLPITASDPDGTDTLTYSATGLPDGLDIDSYTGIISGTVADDAASTTPYQVTVTADDGNGQTSSQTFTWLVNAPVLVAQASPITAVEGSDTGSVTLATFTTSDMNSQASDFAATINYGDGTTDSGEVSGGNGSFTVTGEHTYDDKGSYPVSVTITDTVTGAATTVSATATVTPAPLTATGDFALGAVQGQSSNLTLATFTSGNANLTASNFKATIDWGDGSGVQAAMVSDLGDGVFSVSGSHAYATNGAYTATITITGSDGATTSTTNTITVGNVYAGIQSNLTVASFQDSNTSVPASQFTATIQWGDGTQSSGTVTGGNGTFTVQGTHTYPVDSIDQPNGVYAVTVTIQDPSGNTLTSNNTVTVVRPPITVDTSNVETTQNSLSLNNVQIAVFAVPNMADSTSNFTTMINWGDNTSSNGTIQKQTSGLFNVMGSHTYSAGGKYGISIVLYQGGNTFAPVAAENAQVEAGKDKAGISGPKAVPGNAMYTFTIFNPRIASENDQLESLTISTPEGSQAKAVRYDVTRKAGSQSSLQFNVYFYNEPGLVDFKATFKSKAVATDSVFVVPVKVEDLPGGSFTKSDKTSDDPNKIAEKPNLTFPYIMKGLSSAEPGKAGFAWKAKVTLAPQRSEWLKDIEVGFVQHIYIARLWGGYGEVQGEDRYLLSNMMGHTPPYLDKVTDKITQAPANSPFYSILTPGMKIPPGYLPEGVADRALFTGTKQKNSAIIGAFDTPEAVVPWSFDYKRATDPEKLPKPYAQRIAFTFIFTLDVVAHVAGNGPYSNIYWPQARMEWEFIGNRALDSSKETLPWKGRGYSFVHAIPVWHGLALDEAYWRPMPPYTVFGIPFTIPELTKGPIANFDYAQAVYNPD